MVVIQGGGDETEGEEDDWCGDTYTDVQSVTENVKMAIGLNIEQPESARRIRTGERAS